MRFGIHSGPVTAGVIRSQNARFQLFGDTVNTAARMESNGVAGMIHISEETAEQLAAHGKGRKLLEARYLLFDSVHAHISPHQMRAHFLRPARLVRGS